MYLVSRQQPLNELKKFCQQKKPGFLCVRGRRRIGKSWVLRTLSEELKENVLFFTGKLDESARESLRSFASQWTALTRNSTLNELREEFLTWQRVFTEITQYAKTFAPSFVLIFDEIQWIAGGGSGFIGALKEAWVDWERLTSIKVIICGSSNKFFSKYVGGETTILRGMKTRRDLWIEEFSPTIINKILFPDWTTKEAFCLYLMFGGIPYYLNQFDGSKPFRRALNDVVFLKDSLFLDEWKEILSLDFNTSGLSTSAAILKPLITGHGVTMSEIAEASGLTEDTVRTTLSKLLEYGHIEEHTPLSFDKLVKKINKRGARYTTTDPYLYFYFSTIIKLQKIIEENQSGMLVSRLLFESPHSFHIPQFTGIAFEHAIARFFRYHFTLNSSLAQKLSLSDTLFSMKRNVLVKEEKVLHQLDLLLIHEEERSVRILECKWSDSPSIGHLDDCLAKKVPYEYREYAQRFALVVSYLPSPSFLKEAEKRSVTVIELEDFFHQTTEE